MSDQISMTIGDHDGYMRPWMDEALASARDGTPTPARAATLLVPQQGHKREWSYVSLGNVWPGQLTEIADAVSVVFNTDSPPTPSGPNTDSRGEGSQQSP